MKITVELNSPEELLRFFETMDPTNAAPKQQYQKPTAPAAPDPESAPEAPDPESAPEAPAAPEPVPFAASKTISFDVVTQAAIKKMDAGKQTELRALLQKHGVQALPELKNKPDKLAAFFADLEVL